MTNDLIWLGMFSLVCGVAGIACWLIERTAQTKERHAAATTLQSRSPLAGTASREDRRQLSDRIARDMAQRGYTPAPFHFPAAAHAPEKLDRESGYGTSTRLSLVPKDAA